MRRLGLLPFALTCGCLFDIDPDDFGFDVEPDPVGAPCTPSDPNACDYPGRVCCSDDPAALILDDLAASVTPGYQGREGQGTPLFSGVNNSLSSRGMCVAEGSIAEADALVDEGAQGCPVPCNPTWSAATVGEICGTNRRCCQTVELAPEDCGFDPVLGDGGCWRPLTGSDIQGLGGLDASSWSPIAHATHQDPGGQGCTSFAQRIPPSVLTAAGITESELLIACFRRLSVANLRGFCSPADSVCPHNGPDYVDACEQLNLDEGRSGC